MRITVESDGDGARLDRYISARFPDLTRSLVMKYLKEGSAQLNGRRARPGLLVREGDRIELPGWETALGRIREGKAIGQPTVRRPPPAREIELIFEDEHLVVVNKPAGLVMHPGKGHEEEGLDRILRHHFGPSTRLVHRIDRDTSGVVVAARGHPQSARRLTEAFREGDAEKTYLALVRGAPDPPSGVIQLRLLDTKREGEIVRVDPHGKRARTEYETIEAFRGFAWLAVRPRTGRRHQIRAHLTHIGHALAVDHIYARRRRLRLFEARPDLPHSWKNPVVLARQPLHASEITLRHPKTGADVTFRAPLPRDLDEVLKLLRERKAKEE